MPRSPYRYTRHAGEYAVTRPTQTLTARLGIIRRVGDVWLAEPGSAEQGAHLVRERALDPRERSLRA